MHVSLLETLFLKESVKSSAKPCDVVLAAAWETHGSGMRTGVRMTC